MRIPLELRLMIYGYLFDAGEAKVTIGDEGGCPGSSSSTPSTNKKARDSWARTKTISIRNCDAKAPLRHGECRRCMTTTTTTAATAAAVTQRQEGEESDSDSSSSAGSSIITTSSNLSHPGHPDAGGKRARTRYHVVERSFHRRRVETTYALANAGASFCTALMRASRAVAAETARAVYADHVFDFGPDVEACRPFLSDLSPATRALVRRVALYKRGPWLFDSWSDRCEWRNMCTYLRENANIEHLRLVVQAGRPREAWEAERERVWEWEGGGGGDDSSNDDGDEEEEQEKKRGMETGRRGKPRELSGGDVALLVDIRHDALDWVGDLVRLRSLREVDVRPDFCTVPPPQTSNMFVFLAFSASVDTGFREFLRARLGLVAC
ncbi:putative autophagy-related protein 3 [Rosellinia necatrix]|uniref:Putative autophagy-related protein 3 n=1 Tax=Rosellinia necatrix TaxID=77044 RepID=A0A1S7UID8_ROSNE|nr:putative autophagy-related protein 3 [Rosellinia necatrix]